MLVVTPRISIPYSEFELSYVRSSGPGGQNVNKVNSKAVLRWNAVGSPSLLEPSRSGILARLAPQLTLEGELLVSSDRYRDQVRNREDCFEKLAAIVAAAAHVPVPRKPTRPSRSAKKRVQKQKTQHSDKKALRKKPSRD